MAGKPTYEEWQLISLSDLDNSFTRTMKVEGI